ncbi:MAG: LPXTG cell wall anchor domain-containing protein, partial [Anaerolineaceae bacterium]|nr:LPXTG cell wall anchor domain-containing protein [Anaerolineaceae bacterium]
MNDSLLVIFFLLGLLLIGLLVALFTLRRRRRV